MAVLPTMTSKAATRPCSSARGRQSVAEALASGSAPESDGALGVETVRVLYAAYQSAAEGRRIALR